MCKKWTNQTDANTNKTIEMLGIIGFPAEDLRKKIEPICTKTCLFEPFDPSCAQQEWEHELKKLFVVFALGENLAMYEIPR